MPSPSGLLSRAAEATLRHIHTVATTSIDPSAIRKRSSLLNGHPRTCTAGHEVPATMMDTAPTLPPPQPDDTGWGANQVNNRDKLTGDLSTFCSRLSCGSIPSHSFQHGVRSLVYAHHHHPQIYRPTDKGSNAHPSISLN